MFQAYKVLINQSELESELHIRNFPSAKTFFDVNHQSCDCLTDTYDFHVKPKFRFVQWFAKSVFRRTNSNLKVRFEIKTFWSCTFFLKWFSCQPLLAEWFRKTFFEDQVPLWRPNSNWGETAVCFKFCDKCISCVVLICSIVQYILLFVQSLCTFMKRYLCLPLSYATPQHTFL